VSVFTFLRSGTMSQKLSVLASLPVTLALTPLATLMPSQAHAEPLVVQKRVDYIQAQAITHDIGSKSMRGYYVEKNGACWVVLMISEKIDPESSTPLSAVRVRLVLQPGAVAGLDSAEGLSLNITCGQDAATLRVDEGDTKVLTTAEVAE
jgi:hypothetical protein